LFLPQSALTASQSSGKKEKSKQGIVGFANNEYSSFLPRQGTKIEREDPLKIGSFIYSFIYMIFGTSDEPNQAVSSSLPVPLFCQPLKEHSPGINHIDPRLQGKKKGKSDHRNLLMKSIREEG